MIPWHHYVLQVQFENVVDLQKSAIFVKASMC